MNKKIDHIKVWEKERDIIILAIHEFLLSNPELKEKYAAILKKQRAQSRAFDADTLLREIFPEMDDWKPGYPEPPSKDS